MGIGIGEIKPVIEKLCSVIIQNEVYFCELDSVAGDGDFGMSLAKGFKAVLSQINQIDDSSIQKFLRGCSMIISEFCGGASGPIWGVAFSEAAASVKGKETLELEDIAQIFEAAVAGIQKRGGAKLGDKTLLDALIPVALSLRDSAGCNESIPGALEKASKKAAEGAESTKNMIASRGRASYLGGRSIGSPDAGAVAIKVIFEGALT
jgi:dihydroxyacetone kinase